MILVDADILIYSGVSTFPLHQACTEMARCSTQWAYRDRITLAELVGIPTGCDEPALVSASGIDDGGVEPGCRLAKR